MDFKEKALKLHRENIYVDAHLDLGLELYYRYKAGEKEVLNNHYIEDFKNSGVNIIVAAIYIDDDYPEAALRMALNQISLIMEDIDSTNGEVILIKNRKDLDDVVRRNGIGIILSLEGLDPIINDLSMLRIFYELGVRGAGIVWSRRNYAADGCYFKSSENEGIKGGLTRFGVSAVKELERLGIWIDVSHLNDEGFDDVMKFTHNPFIASHSNAREVTAVNRNLMDDQIKSIASRGGVIGLNGLMIENGLIKEKRISRLCDHADYIKNLVGTEYMGFGFDMCDKLDSCEPHFKNHKEEKSDAAENHTEVLMLTEELLRRGYTDEELIGIIGGNFLRYFRNILL